MKRALHPREARRLVALTVAIALVLPASPAAAAPPTAEARARAAESFREAQAAFERRDFAAAAAAFEAAAGFAPHPAALLSAGDAWDRAGEPARAAEDCDRARALPDAAAASEADRVDYARDAAQCLERLRARVALVDVRGRAPATVRIDDGPQQLLPVRAWVRPGATRWRSSISPRRAPASRRSTSGQGRSGGFDLSAPPPAAAPAPPPAPDGASPTPAPTPSGEARGRHVPTATWVAAGVAAPAAIAYGVFCAMTVQAKNAFDASPSQDAKNTFYRDRTLADVAFGVAAAAAVAGLVIWLAAPSGDPARAGLVEPGVLRF